MKGRIWLWASSLLLVSLFSLSGLARPSGSEKDEPPRVELNSASLEELCELPGIGPKKASAIIAEREKRRFTRVSQLLRVKGIGYRTLRRLKPYVFVARRAIVGRSPSRETRGDDRVADGREEPAKPDRSRRAPRGTRH